MTLLFSAIVRAMLFIKDISLNFGPRQLFRRLSLSLLEGERVAFVGQNGMGKSTLLKVLCGEIEPDEGKVEYRSGLRIGMLAQEPRFDGKQSVWEVMQQVARPHTEDEYNTDYRIERVLSKLGVRARDEKIETLSGGERRRVDVARLLLSEPDVYLLDEPTNHLDVSAIAFLADMLKSGLKPVLFISHDRNFIDTVATKIIELDKGEMYSHPVPYQAFMESKFIRTDINLKTAHKRDRIMARELAWLRAGTPARTTKQQARIGRAEELIEQVSKDMVENRERIMRVQRAKAGRLAKTILELRDVGYKIGDRQLFSNVNLIVVEGERFGIIGPNGVGKTTLMKLMTGELTPTTGEVIRGPHTEFALFDQNRALLNPNDTLSKTLADHGDTVIVGDERIHIASYLERFLFDPSDMYRHVSTLSGGEQNRLLLAKLFKTSANCLLLDEPTNDLDLTSLGVLEEVLGALKGVAFIVSHDRVFLDRVCTGIIAFEPNGKIEIYQGSYSTYERLKAEKLKESTRALSLDPSPTSGRGEAEIGKTKKRKRSYNEEREYATIEEMIQKTEQERDSLSAQIADGSLFASDAKKAQEIMKKIAELETKIESLYLRWEELENL